jgi:hypothetical protein
MKSIVLENKLDWKVKKNKILKKIGVATTASYINYVPEIFFDGYPVWRSKNERIIYSLI